MSNWTRRKFLTVTTVAGVAAAELAAQTPRRTVRPKGQTRYAVHPAVGVPRLGNSPDEFYLEPQTIGGLPIECRPDGTPRMDGGKPVFVKKFKDGEGRIKRQGAQFRIYAFDSNDPYDPGREITLDDPDVESIEWTVHLANKKAVWYNNDQFIGNVYLAGDRGADRDAANYYPDPALPPTPTTDAALRNWYITNDKERQKQLIIDPGPRKVSRPGQKAKFSRDTIPADYPKGSFPPVSKDNPRVPYEVDTLGDMMMAPSGRLVVLGGFGRTGGEIPIATYTGQDTWFDDIADGPVWCRLKLKGREEPIELSAWALVGSPKYAPELRSISTLDDIMFDVGTRFHNLVPELYDEQRYGGYNPNFEASYTRDVEPILERIGDYIWVANIQSMVAFISPRFNPRDASEANRKKRETFFSYFRDSSKDELSEPHQRLFHNRIPMVPLNSGSNSVTNDDQDKYMGLTRTQYFLLKQWAQGKFTNGTARPWPNAVHPLDRASAGNCVGHPMSPGIETTWTTRNPVIYSAPYRIKIHKDEAYYREHGLGTLGDETGTWYARYGNGIKGPAWMVVHDGCEPGDMTKRMSGPWMSDFYQCSVEYVNFSDPPRRPQPNTTAITEIPTPPTYYTYWWPPQAPMHVLTGTMNAEEQAAAGVPSGFQVYYTRGANNIGNLVIAWSYMGFITNENVSPEGRMYPYFVETERNHDRFVTAAVAVGSPINQLSATGSYLQPTNYFTLAWFMKDEEAIAACDGVPPDDPRCKGQDD